ncbi:MAG: hypothetical protein M3N52_06785 [Actinomycetota bacterium]|nr:hypothetical protein [Actinomycetota bacterium]
MTEREAEVVADRSLAGLPSVLCHEVGDHYRLLCCSIGTSDSRRAADRLGAGILDRPDQRAQRLAPLQHWRQICREGFNAAL